MPFGQLVIGPAGSGKTTFCHGMQQFLTLLGRKAVVVNLDPANGSLPYDCAVDLADLVSLDQVMQNLGLGPNGGLIFCMEFLVENMDWLEEKLKPLVEEQAYFIFDFPGQAELFCLHNSLQRVVEVMTKQWHISLAAVQLVDSHLCTDAGKYISALLLTLESMVHLELPQVNVLSKADLFEQYSLDNDLDFYAEVQDVSQLIETLASEGLGGKYSKLTGMIAESGKRVVQVVTDYNLVQFTPVAVEDKEAMEKVVREIDRATGYIYTGKAGYDPYHIQVSSRDPTSMTAYQDVGTIQEQSGE